MELFKATGTNTSFNENKNLTQLANQLEMDKGTSDKKLLSWGKNWPDNECMGYTETYEKYMFPYKNDHIKLFEIGIYDKRFPYASPYMWLGYFKNIELYCADNFWGNKLHEKLLDIEKLNINGINFIYADQGNFCDWDDIKKSCPHDFNFFIEDGSHWPNHMMVSLWQSRDLILSGGYYFMEDIQNPKRTRGKYKYDNSIVGEDLLEAIHSGTIDSRMLNAQQNSDINENFKLVDLVLDKHKTNYLAVFRKY